MSNAPGAVRFDDGVIMFVEYNGCSDYIRPGLMLTQDDVSTHWRHGDAIGGCAPCPHIGENKRCHECKHSQEDAEFVTTYGDGWMWPVKACRICMVVTDHLTPYDPTQENRWEAEDGYPEWSPWQERD